MDSEKWKKIKRSGGFRRKVNRSYKLLKTATIPTLLHLGETKRCQAQGGSNENGSVHFSTFNQANAGTSQDSIYQSGSTQVVSYLVCEPVKEFNRFANLYYQRIFFCRWKWDKYFRFLRRKHKDMEEAESSEDDEDDKDDEFQ